MFTTRWTAEQERHKWQVFILTDLQCVGLNTVVCELRIVVDTQNKSHSGHYVKRYRRTWGVKVFSRIRTASHITDPLLSATICNWATLIFSWLFDYTNSITGVISSIV